MGRLAADDPERSFAAHDRKVHMIDGAFFVDEIISLGLQARLFERAPEEVLLARAEEQVVDLPGLIQSFAVGQDKSDSPQVTPTVPSRQSTAKSTR